MSSKKPFDHIEEKIKEAAGNYQLAFDEMAWKAMEAKLDEEKKQRRPIFWWFVLPLLVAASWGVYYKFNTAAKPVEKQIAGNVVDNKNVRNNDKNVAEKATDNNDVTKPVIENFENKNNKNNEQNKPVIAFKNDNVNADNRTTLITPSSVSFAKGNKISLRKKGKVKASNSAGSVATIGNDANIYEEKINKEDENKSVNAERNEDAKATNEIIEPTTNIDSGNPNNEEKKQPAQKDKGSKAEQQAEAPEKKKEKTKSKGFYVQATGGIDAGSTKLFSYGNSIATAKYGFGIGYKFNKRLSVQTGFYSNLKKYAAAPADYTIKANSPMGTYPLDGIKATCFIYEIPLAVKYDFISKPSVIVYATAGISSYIMQKEKYDCFYTYYNTVYESAWIYKGNKHLFSTAVFSIGIEKALSSKISLLAEPSISVPLTGVGDGKMKIYSSSLQLGLKYYLLKK